MTTPPAPDSPPIVRLFDGAHLRADLACGAQGPARDLIITFDYRQIARSDFGVMIPSARFAAAGFDQLMIATRANDWFINPDTASLTTHLTPLRDRYTRRHALGFSMGGFGAFRFSAALGLSRVIAVSPQVSIAAAQVPFETRYQREARDFDAPLGDLTPLHDPALRGAILCDPFNAADLRHARMLQGIFPGVRVIRLPGGGHPATRVLRAANRAGLVQRLVLDPVPGYEALQRTHRAVRGTQAGYWTARAAAATARHPAAARSAAAMAMKLQDGLPDRVDADDDSA